MEVYVIDGITYICLRSCVICNYTQMRTIWNQYSVSDAITNRILAKKINFGAINTPRSVWDGRLEAYITILEY